MIPIPIPSQLPMSNELINTSTVAISVTCVAFIPFFTIKSEIKNKISVTAKPIRMGAKTVPFNVNTSFQNDFLVCEDSKIRLKLLPLKTYS